MLLLQLSTDTGSIARPLCESRASCNCRPVYLLFGSEKSVFPELVRQSVADPNQIRYTWTGRGHNVQRTLGVIGPFLAKWGAGMSPAEPEFFCVVIQTTFRQLRNGRFSPNLATKRNSVSRR